MATLRETHSDGFEGEFYDQGGAGELTIPNAHNIYWRHDASDETKLNRVEADAKDANLGHPEVFEGRYSAALMWTHSSGSAALVSDKIYLGGHIRTRIKASYMHWFANGGAGGARLGVVFAAADPFNGEVQFETPSHEGNPFEDARIVWGSWVSTAGGWPNRVWTTLESPTFVLPPGYLRYVLQFNSDWAIPGSGHFDAVSIIQEFPDDPPIDPPVDPPVEPPVDPPPSTGILADVQAAIALMQGVEAALVAGGVDVVLVDGAVKAVLL